MKIVVVQRGVNRHWPVFPQSYRPPYAPFSDHQSDRCDDAQRPCKCRIFHLTQKWQAICWRGAKAQPFLITFYSNLGNISFTFLRSNCSGAWIFGGLGHQIQRRLRNAPLVHGGGHEFACGQHHGIARFLRGIFKHNVIAPLSLKRDLKTQFFNQGRDQIPLDTTARSQ